MLASMYVRRSTRRRLSRASLVLVSIVVLLPQLDFSVAPQLTALLGEVGLGPTQQG